MLCAQGVVRDVDSNGISVYSILENIRPAGYPVLIQSCFVLAFLEKLPEDAERIEDSIRLTLGDVELANVPIVADFLGCLSHRSLVQLQVLFLPNPVPLTF